jgi:hypothetical protein
MKVEAVLRAYLHDHFDGSELLVFVRNNENLHDIANVHAVQPHRRAHAQPLRIVEIGDEHDAVGEESGGSGHEE